MSPRWNEPLNRKCDVEKPCEECGAKPKAKKQLMDWGGVLWVVARYRRHADNCPFRGRGRKTKGA